MIESFELARQLWDVSLGDAIESWQCLRGFHLLKPLLGRRSRHPCQSAVLSQPSSRSHVDFDAQKDLWIPCAATEYVIMSIIVGFTYQGSADEE